MRLRIGERFPGSGPTHQPGGYVVTEVIQETPWQGLYAGKKIFYNFDFTAKRPRETEEKEWLSVFLRTIHYPHPEDPTYVAGRRTLAQAEASRILGKGRSNLWPEPVDVLQVPNTQDPFAFAELRRGEPGALATGATPVANAVCAMPTPADSECAMSRNFGPAWACHPAGLEPILVFARPTGVLLTEWQKSWRSPGSILGVLAELLDFLKAAEEDGVVLNGLGPDSVLVDKADRVHYLATDMVLDAAVGNGSRKFFPAERYPVGFTPPEYYDFNYRPNGRGDLFSWGCIAHFLICGDDPARIARAQHRPWVNFQESHFEQIERALRAIPPAHVQTWAEQLELNSGEIVDHWPANALTVLRRLVSRSPQLRPANVQQLKDWLVAPPAPSAIPEAARGALDSAQTLPPAQTVPRLWERVLLDGDIDSHRQLVELVSDLPIPVDPLANGAQVSPHPYVASLERELEAREIDGQPVLSRSEIENLLQCLHESAIGLKVPIHLLQSGHYSIRELGREFLVGTLRERLQADSVQASDIRRELESVCPADVPEEKLLICRRLAEVGVHATAVHGCLVDLQEERLTWCSECPAKVRIRDVETHLRRAHGIFQFRGINRSFHDTRALLLDAVCGLVPDYAAWRSLEGIARDRHEAEAGPRLVSWLSQKLRVLGRDHRNEAVRSLAEAIVAARHHSELVPLLCKRMKAESLEVVSRHLALEILATAPAPVSDDVLTAAEPVLADKRLGRDIRQRAAASLLKTTGQAGAKAVALLDAYVAGSGKLRAIDKLHELEQQVGPMPAIEALCAMLEGQVRMTCPRCTIELPRAQMTKHLWDNHRLVLDGRRVREPWRVMEDWIEDYRLEKDAAILTRCRELAERLEGDEGSARLERLLLQHGIDDPQARARLQEQARNNSATLCPHCYDLVALQPLSRPTAVQETDDKLDVGGYTLETSENSLVPWVEVDGPQGIRFEGNQAGRTLTRNGFLIFLVGPLVLTGFILVEWLTSSRWPPTVSVALAIGLGLFLTGLVYFFWPVAATPRDQLVDLAWAHLATRLHARGFDESDSAHLAGLALFSIGYGRAEDRAANLETLREYTEAAVRKHEDCLPHLAALWRLTVEDARDAGEDHIPLLVTQLDRCFNGKLPLRYAGALLARCQRPGDKDEGGRMKDEQGRPSDSSFRLHPSSFGRLHVLACERAFQDGLEPADLMHLGRSEPALQEVMRLNDLGELAQLYLLWKLRGERPWERLGEARTVFDLAAAPPAEAEGNAVSAKVLGEFPDILWIVSGSVPLYVCARGLFFEDALITELPAKIEIISRKIVGDDRHDLIIGPHSFRFSYEPDRLAKRIEAWLRYYYREFLPQVRAASLRRSRDAARKVHARNDLVCPECRTLFLPRLGDVGLPVEERDR